MSHPLIPPKSRFIVRDECSLLKGGIEAEPFFTLTNQSLWELNAHWRQVVAAVAEIEWRRRAKRWEKLLIKCSLWCDGEYYTMNPKNQARHNFLSRGLSQCLLNAEAWRAWAEQ